MQEAVSEGSAAMREAIEETISEEQERERGLVRMPPWRDNPDVRRHIEELYAYLTARADQVIGADVPELMEE